MFSNAFTNKSVWLSGHTGFKGSWLTLWLTALGAKVHGYSLPPPTRPSLFDQLGLADLVETEIGNVLDAEAVSRSLRRADPDFVFHLAAQPLVREAYARPVATFATNVQGTAHVLEALRSLSRPCAAVFVTSDKCYDNHEWVYGYREEDALGGHDPYSASKAAAEIVIQAYRRSFFAEHPVRVASARAGNVIGGGDWSADRIVPDCIRRLEQNQPIELRNPHATRPWQHVLEPLSGYLWLAAVLAGPGLELLQINAEAACSAFNFGPEPGSNRRVAQLVDELLKHWPGRWEDASDPLAVHEARLLQLSIEKARVRLQWSPVWTFEEAVANTVDWYQAAQRLHPPGRLQAFSNSQIESYCNLARRQGVLWAQSPATDHSESLHPEEPAKACAV